MEIIKVIDAANLDGGTKVTLRYLVEQISLALSENESAIGTLYSSKASLNERQYEQRLGERMSNDKRRDLILQQLAKRNQFANSVYRAQGAQRRLQQLGLLMLEQYRRLDVTDVLMQPVAVELRRTLDRCVRAGAKTPNAIAHELSRVADVKKGTIEDSVRIIFQQKKAGVGEYADINFSSQPIMFTEQDSAEVHALWVASQVAIKQFYEIRAAHSMVETAKSMRNPPQFAERIEQAGNDPVKLARVSQQRASAEANLFVAASYYLQLASAYQAKIDKFAAAIAAAASTVHEPRGNKQLSVASNCIGAWHWLHEMKMQLDIVFRPNNDPREILKQLDFDVEAYLAAA